MAHACFVGPSYPATTADLEELQKAESSETVFIGVVVFYTDYFNAAPAPFKGETPVLKVLKNLHNTVEGSLHKGMAGGTCTGSPPANLGDVVIYHSGHRPAQLLLESADPAIYEYTKQHFGLDIRSVDKSIPFSERAMFELRQFISGLGQSNTWVYVWCGGLLIAYFIRRKKRQMKKKA